MLCGNRYFKKCVIFIGTNTDQTINDQVNIMFVDDKGSILLEDGVGFSLPSPYGSSYNFTYTSIGKDISTLSVSSPAYELSLSATEKQTKGTPANFVVTGRNNIALHIPKDKLSSTEQATMGITLKNIEHEIDIEFNTPGTERTAFDMRNYIQIQASSGVTDLIPELRSSHTLGAGVCKYFSLSKMASSSGVVSVTAMLPGQISVYIKKSATGFAEANNNDYEARSDLAVMISLNSSSETSTQRVEDYSVAVCSRDPVQFNILLNLDLVVPFTNIPAGDILKREIQAGESFAVQYTASKNEKFTVNVDTETSTAFVYHAEYSNNMDISSIVSMIPETTSSNLLFSTSGSGIPGSNTIVAPNDQLVTNYIFRITPSNTDLITFYIGSSKPSAQIALRQNEKLQERLSKGENRTYVLRTAELERELKLMIKVAYGQIVIHTLTENDDKNESKADIVGGNGETVKEIIITPRQKQNQLNPLESVIREATVVVETKTDSMFDIIFEQPQESFMRIVPGKQYSVNNEKNVSDIKYFYQIRDTKDIESFKVYFMLDEDEIECSTNFKDHVLQRTKFYYITNEDFSIEDDDSLSKIVADIKDSKDMSYSKRKIVSFEFAVQKGFFMMTFSRSQEISRYSLSFELSMNNYFTLGANNYILDYSEPAGYSGYQIYVPQAGKLYIDFEDCSNQLVAFGSQDIYKTRPHAKDRSKLVTESIQFNEPGFYYVLVMHRQGLQGSISTDTIPYILRTEFMDQVRYTWLSSYFAAVGGNGLLDASKVVITTSREGLKASISGSIEPSSSLATDFNEIDEISVTTIAVASKVGDRTKRPKLACKDLDQQLINFGKVFKKIDNATTFAINTAVFSRDTSRSFNWSVLKAGMSVDVQYPLAVEDDANRDMMVSVILLYRLYGNKTYDAFDDSSVVMAMMMPVTAPQTVEFKDDSDNGDHVKICGGRDDPDRNNGAKILIYVILSFILLLGGAWFLRKYMNKRETVAEGFEQASRVNASDIVASGDTKQIEISQNQEPREDTDHSI